MSTETPKERLISFGALLALLLIAGVTASLVGYRIKSGEWKTRATLDRVYKSLHNEPLNPIITKPLTIEVNIPENRFLIAYEFNQLVKGFGLIRALNNLPHENIEPIIAALKLFEGSSSAIITERVWKMVTKKEPLTDVQREARRYNTPEARRLERELFKFTSSLKGASSQSL